MIHNQVENARWTLMRDVSRWVSVLSSICTKRLVQRTVQDEPLHVLGLVPVIGHVRKGGGRVGGEGARMTLVENKWNHILLIL